MRIKGTTAVLLLVAALGAVGFSAYWTFFRSEGPQLTAEQKKAAEAAVANFRKK